MSWFTDLYRSAVGKKAVMAVTGIILFGFIVLHLIGNLKLYEPGMYSGGLCQGSHARRDTPVQEIKPSILTRLAFDEVSCAVSSISKTCVVFYDTPPGVMPWSVHRL